MSKSILRGLVRNFPENGPKLLLENPANIRDLLTLLREPAVDAIDFSEMTVERTHFVKADYAHVATDILLKAPFHSHAGKTREAVFIYLLVEHQSKPQRFLQLRLADYVLEAYKMQKRAWDQRNASDAALALSAVLPIVLYTGERSWARIEPLDELVHEGNRFKSMIPQFTPHFLNLRDVSTSTLESEGGFFGSILHLIKEQHTDFSAFRVVIGNVMERLEAMPASERNRWIEFLSYALALVYHARTEKEHSPLVAAIETSVQSDPHRTEYGKMGRTIAQMFIDQGVEKGMRKGLQKGEIKGEIKSRQTVLLRQLRNRFKTVPPAVQARIAETEDVPTLDAWLDRVLDAKKLADVGID